MKSITPSYRSHEHSSDSNSDNTRMYESARRKHSKEEISIRRKAAGTILATVALFGSLTIIKSLESGSPSIPTQVSQEYQSNGNKLNFEDANVTFNASGNQPVHLRTNPGFSTDPLGNRTGENVGHTFTKQTTVEKPVIYKDEQGDSWLGVLIDGQYMWANQNELQREYNDKGAELLQIDYLDDNESNRYAQINDGLLVINGTNEVLGRIPPQESNN